MSKSGKSKKATTVARRGLLGSSVVVGTMTMMSRVLGLIRDVVFSRVIGADGFGFAPHESKHYKKIIQVGNVVIEDDVEIGANTTIDKATLGSTIIRKGVKLDNLIQVAHNVEIGENTVIAAQTGISGTVKIGSNCLIGGQVGISGHLTIGNDVKIAAQSGISKNIKDGEVLMGSPSFAIGEYKKAYVHFRNLDKHIKKLNEIGSYIKKRNDF